MSVGVYREHKSNDIVVRLRGFEDGYDYHHLSESDAAELAKGLNALLGEKRIDETAGVSVEYNPRFPCSYIVRFDSKPDAVVYLAKSAAVELVKQLDKLLRPMSGASAWQRYLDREDDMRRAAEAERDKWKLLYDQLSDKYDKLARASEQTYQERDALRDRVTEMQDRIDKEAEEYKWQLDEAKRNPCTLCQSANWVMHQPNLAAQNEELKERAKKQCDTCSLARRYGNQAQEFQNLAAENGRMHRELDQIEAAAKRAKEGQ